MKLFSSSTGKYGTTCKLCGKRVAESPALEIPIIGHPGAKVEKLMSVLLKHLATHHGHDLKVGAALLQEFQAFRILSAFEYEDPTMTPRLENIRAAVFGIVRKNSFTDATLQHITATWGLDPDDAAKVFEGLKAVRDACCEFGPYAPSIPEESKVVTAG